MAVGASRRRHAQAQRVGRCDRHDAVDPVRDELGWAFRKGSGFSEDPINGFHYLSEANVSSDPNYRGRVTVPVLWDKKTKQIVSNNDDHVLRMFETDFDAIAKVNDVDYYPEEPRAGLDELNERIYETVNNGVYRARFAALQDHTSSLRATFLKPWIGSRSAWPRRATCLAHIRTNPIGVYL